MAAARISACVPLVLGLGVNVLDALELAVSLGVALVGRALRVWLVGGV